MSDQEINEAIAKAIGWTGIKPSGRLDGQMVGYPNRNPIIGKPQEIPDFANDLNLSDQFEQTLFPVHVWQLNGDDRWKEYRETLNVICVGHAGGSITATARQRAEAFLKVKNL